jgi:spore coat polysaccharide biosynthesis predicted glycosyltransferase SpsG
MIKDCYFRVDANNMIGIGHLVRSEILADELSKNNYQINFLCRSIPKNYTDSLKSKNYQVSILSTSESEQDVLLDVIEKKDQSLLIIDSDIEEFYTKNFQLSIRNNGIKLMIITFYHKCHFYADIILNQNIMALSQSYSTEDYTVKLLGPKNVILNNHYKIISENLDNIKTKLINKTILLTFGGVDQPDRTSFVYKSLTQIKNKPSKIIVVLGGLYENRKNLERIVNKSRIPTEIYQNTPKMPYLLAESDIVFNSGGLTVWEAGVLKALNVIIGFSNREQIGGRFIGDNNLGIYLGKKDDFNSESLSEKINAIIVKDNTKLINKLSSKIDVNGINNTIKSINKLV